LEERDNVEEVVTGSSIVKAQRQHLGFGWPKWVSGVNWKS